MKSYQLLLLMPCCTLLHAMDMQGMAGMDMSTMPGMTMPAHRPHHPTAQANKTAHPHHASKKVVVPQHSAPEAMPAGMKMDTATPAATHADTVHMADMPGMDHGAMQMPDQQQTMDHTGMAMPAMDMHHDHAMAPIPAGDGRNPDYSQGRDFGPLHPPMMMGNDPLFSLSAKRLEWLHSDGQNQGAYEFEGWWGTDWNRVVLKAEGDFDRHSLSDARTELLWRRPMTPFWNSELGIRQDSGNTQDRTWLALGINGIAPYFLDLDATFYVRDQLQTALILQADYDWRLTQRFILQPRLEAQLYGKSDRANSLGSGLSELQAGVRLRYEWSRQFAPYIGFEVTRHYGQTADLLQQEGLHTGQNSLVAGVMLWY